MVKQPVIHALTLPCVPCARCVIQTQVCWRMRFCCTAGGIKKNKTTTTVGQLSLIMPERTRALSRGECDVQLWRSQSETYEVGLLWQPQPAVVSRAVRVQGLVPASVPDSISNNHSRSVQIHPSPPPTPPPKKKLMDCTYTQLCPVPKVLYNGLSAACLHTLAAAAIEPARPIWEVRVFHVDSQSWDSTSWPLPSLDGLLCHCIFDVTPKVWKNRNSVQ